MSAQKPCCVHDPDVTPPPWKLDVVEMQAVAALIRDRAHRLDLLRGRFDRQGAPPDDWLQGIEHPEHADWVDLDRAMRGAHLVMLSRGRDCNFAPPRMMVHEALQRDMKFGIMPRWLFYYDYSTYVLPKVFVKANPEAHFQGNISGPEPEQPYYPPHHYLPREDLSPDGEPEDLWS